MVKKIHSVNKKKGMSLVEMMASLAVFLILFGGITSMILTNMKAEIKSNTRIENISYIKAIIAMFEDTTGTNITIERTEGNSTSIVSSVNYYISDDIFNQKFLNKDVYINFDYIDEISSNSSEEQLQEKLLAGNVLSWVDSASFDGKTYQCRIKVSEEPSQPQSPILIKLYSLEVTVKNNFKGEEVRKKVYINRFV